jgi:hypothetical protein
MFTSCEKQVNRELNGTLPDVIAVNGIITNEFQHQTIKLTHPVSQLNETPKPVSGATIMVSTEDSVFLFNEQPAGSGIYLSSNAFVGMTNKSYTLQIYYNNKVISAQAAMMEGELFSPLHYSKNSSDDFYHISWVANSYSSGDYAMWEVLMDWSNVPSYQHTNPDSCKATLYYYTLPTLDVNQIIAPGKQTVSFPAGTIITERRYSLTEEHAEYFRALLLETTWQGGMFDVERANVPTNLSSGAIGFFGACSVTTLSLTVNP